MVDRQSASASHTPPIRHSPETQHETDLSSRETYSQDGAHDTAGRKVQETSLGDLVESDRLKGQEVEPTSTS